MTKSKRRTVLEDSRDDLAGVLERLREIAAMGEPYLADAQGFVTQAIVCLEKQLAADFPEAKPPVAKESAPAAPVAKSRMEAGKQGDKAA